MNKTSNELILLELYKNKSISYTTIDLLMRYGFDTNETLLTLDVDMDLALMTDICLSQKSLLRQLLDNYRRLYGNRRHQYRCSSSDDDDHQHREEEAVDDDEDRKHSFPESHSVVQSLRKLFEVHLNGRQLGTDGKDVMFTDMSFDPIVDQLRESLIRVEKQKQEKDMLLERQRLEMTVKDMEIRRLQTEVRQLDQQLMAERLNVEKLNYKLKSIISETIDGSNGKKHFSNTSNDYNNCNKSLNDLKAIYYNKKSCNNSNESDGDCEPYQSSSATTGAGVDDRPLTPGAHSSMTAETHDNIWTEVENNTNVFDRNLDELKTSLFATYVTTRKMLSTGSGGDDSHRPLNDDLTDDEHMDESAGSFDGNSIDSKISESFDKSLKTFESFGSTTEDKKMKTIGEEDNGRKHSDIEEVEKKFCPQKSQTIDSDHESIVCEPDIECEKKLIQLRPENKCPKKKISPNFVRQQTTTHQTIVNRVHANQTHRQFMSSLTTSSASVKSLSVKHFRCEYQNCGFSFVSSEGLKRHIRSAHTKEKPYKCHFEECQKRFGRSDALKEHVKRHLGLKLYKCEYSCCDFESVSSNSLKRHINSIHLKHKHFNCLYENCGKTFGRKDSLKKHIEKQHLIC